MRGEATIFSAQFADMFNKFVKQQLDFQKNLEKTLSKIANNTSTADKSTKQNNNFENYQGELGKFNAKEKREQSSKKRPREVDPEPTPVTLVSISKKAAAALKDNDTFISNITGGGDEKKSGLAGLLGGTLGPLLMSLLKFIGIPALGLALGRIFDIKPFLSALGLSGAIPKIASMLSQGVSKMFSKIKLGDKVTKFFSTLKGFKFLQPFLKPLSSIMKGAAALKPVGSWLFRKLPGIGFLLSLGIGMDKIMNGEGQVIEGLLDISAGIAYMFPGVGTVIGLGIDALNWFMHSDKMSDEDAAARADLKSTPIGFKSFSDIFTEALYDFKAGRDTVLGKFGKIGLAFGDFASNPSLGSFIPFAENVMGSYSPFVMGLKFLNGDDLMPDIEDAESSIGWTILKETLLGPFYGLVTNLFSKATDMLAEQFGLFQMALEDEAAMRQGDIDINEKYKKSSAMLYDKLLKDNEDLDVMTYDSWAKSTGRVDKRGKGGIHARKDQYQSYQSYLEQIREGTYEDESPYDLDVEMSTEGDVNIKSKVPVTPFPEDNNSLPEIDRSPSIKGGRTEEEILNDPNTPYLPIDKNDFSQLIDTAKEQSQMLAAMLQQNKSNNIVAPSTTNNYTYVVESGVSKFRNSVNPIA